MTAINPKSRNEQDKKDLRVYYSKHRKFDLNIIQKVLKKFLYLEMKAKTVAQRVLRSRNALSDDLQHKTRKQNRERKWEVRATEEAEQMEKIKKVDREHKSEVCATEDVETTEKRKQKFWASLTDDIFGKRYWYWFPNRNLLNVKNPT